MDLKSQDLQEIERVSQIFSGLVQVLDYKKLLIDFLEEGTQEQYQRIEKLQGLLLSESAVKLELITSRVTVSNLEFR